MRYWWVNQNQTYKHEIEGGYLWSPRANRNGDRNQFYENMRLVEPGDLVFSFCDTRIRQVGTVSARAVPCQKPAEFGSAGDYWSTEGWLVGIQWEAVNDPIRPKEHIEHIRPFLAQKYAPLTKDGNGLQSVYLAEVTPEMAFWLLDKMGIEANNHSALVQEPAELAQVNAVEAAIESQIKNNTDIDATTKAALVQARRGQGRFRRNVESFEPGCRITGVTDRRLLRASHIKPWRVCETNHERLDGNNGLLLTPTFDALFDAGYISFADDGGLLVGNAIADDQLKAIGLGNSNNVMKGAFSQEQAAYLAYHRKILFSRNA